MKSKIDAMLCKSYPKEYAHWILKNSYIFAIHEDYVDYREIQGFIIKYNVSFYRMSDGFHYLCNNFDKVNVEAVLKDRHELTLDNFGEKEIAEAARNIVATEVLYVENRRMDETC